MNANTAIIEMAGQPVEFRFGISFWSRLMRHFNEKDLKKILKMLKQEIPEDPYGIVPIMMLQSRNVALKRAKKREITLDEMVDLIDQDGGIASTAIGEYLTAWSASVNQDVPEDEDQGKKKPAKEMKKRPTTTTTLAGNL